MNVVFSQQHIFLWFVLVSSGCDRMLSWTVTRLLHSSQLSQITNKLNAKMLSLASFPLRNVDFGMIPEETFTFSAPFLPFRGSQDTLQHSRGRRWLWPWRLLSATPLDLWPLSGRSRLSYNSRSAGSQRKRQKLEDGFKHNRNSLLSTWK